MTHITKGWKSILLRAKPGAVSVKETFRLGKFLLIMWAVREAAMDNGMQKKEKDMLMGASSLPGREMDISRLINRDKGDRLPQYNVH